ncbi:hypothetical protein [Mycobacterium triplex]|uniref:hypothetical protein n=1 Tax=Mycobacterium triplex TaxID=47839 RepID=UPI000A62554C|nr:hypothetical protein [Mycobacterium triplex]
MTYTTRSIGENQLAWHLDMGGKTTEVLLCDGKLDNGWLYNFAFSARWEGMALLGEEKAEWPGVTLTLVSPEGDHRQIVELFPPEEMKTEHFGITIGNNTFVGRVTPEGLPAGYDVKIEFEDFGLELSADVVNTGTLFSDDEHGLGYYDAAKDIGWTWWPLAPRSTVTATTKLAGRTETSSGIGYLEKDIANLDALEMSDWTSTWYWGHAWTDEYTLNWSVQYGHENFNYRPFASLVVWKGSDPVFVTRTPMMSPIKFEWDDVLNVAYPSHFTILGTHGDFEVFLRITDSTLFERFPLISRPEQQGENMGAILRSFGDVDIEITRLGKVEKLKGRSTFENGQMVRWIPIPKS